MNPYLVELSNSEKIALFGGAPTEETSFWYDAAYLITSCVESVVDFFS